MSDGINERLRILVSVLNANRDVGSVGVILDTENSHDGNKIITGTLEVFHCNDESTTSLKVEIVSEKSPVGWVEMYMATSPDISNISLVTCGASGLYKSRLWGKGQRYSESTLTSALVTLASLASMGPSINTTLIVDGEDIHIKNNESLGAKIVQLVKKHHV